MEIQSYSRKGFNALCAELLSKGEVVFIWGVSLFEVRSRAQASGRKRNLMQASSHLLNTEMVEEPEGGLERLYQWVDAISQLPGSLFRDGCGASSNF